MQRRESYRGRRVVLRTETFLRAGEHLHVEWSGTRVACRQRLPAATGRRRRPPWDNESSPRGAARQGAEAKNTVFVEVGRTGHL